MTGVVRESPRHVRGIWLAYYSDWSGVVPFRDELPCLRHAIEHAMQAMFCPFGRDPRDVEREKRAGATS